MSLASGSLLARVPGRAFAGTTSAALVLLALGGCTESTGPEAGSDDAQDKILFLSTRAALPPQATPLTDIFRMNADGTGVERLTTQSAQYHFLRLSPDGTHLAFYAGGLSPCYDLFVMNPDGTGLTRITGIVAYERCNTSPYWSPDSRKIAFISTRDLTFGWDAFVINADGTGVVNVSNNPNTTTVGHYDDAVEGWSPDGRVVLLSERDGMERTWLVNANGADIQPLFGSARWMAPHWSPGGGKLIAESQKDGDWEVYAMNADGTGAVNLSNDAAYDGLEYRAADPWSPDGTRIAFRSRRTGNDDVFVVRADGTGLVNVSNAPGGDSFRAWTPDGRILFASDRTGDLELWVVNADGSGAVNLTKSPASADGDYAIWVRRQ